MPDDPTIRPELRVLQGGMNAMQPSTGSGATTIPVATDFPRQLEGAQTSYSNEPSRLLAQHVWKSSEAQSLESLFASREDRRTKGRLLLAGVLMAAQELASSFDQEKGVVRGSSTPSEDSTPQNV